MTKKTTDRDRVQEAAASRARAREVPAKVPKDTEERVQFIMTLMELGTWDRYLCRQLAATWGVTPRRVRDHSAEAHRRLSEERKPEDRSQARRDLTDRLMAWAALDAGEGDRRTANKHIELVAKINGLLRTQREVEFQEESRQVLEIAEQVLPRDLFRKFLTALVAASKGEWIPEQLLPEGDAEANGSSNGSSGNGPH